MNIITHMKTWHDLYMIAESLRYSGNHQGEKNNAQEIFRLAQQSEDNYQNCLKRLAKLSTDLKTKLSRKEFDLAMRELSNFINPKDLVGSATELREYEINIHHVITSAYMFLYDDVPSKDWDRLAALDYQINGRGTK